MKTRLLIILVTVGVMVTIAGVSVASPSINNFDDFVYQLKEPFDGAEPEPVPMKCKSGPAPSDDHYYDEETCKWIAWYEGEQIEKIIQYCTEPESNPTGETSSISKGGEIKLDSKKCTWFHGGFYNQVWVNQTADPVPLIQNGNVMSPEGNVLRPVK